MTSNRRLSVTVLMTCHNRRDATVRCLEAVFAQTAVSHINLQVLLVDDGSSDGTADAVHAAFPRRVSVLPGNGKLFWNGGMRLAFARAMALGFDFCVLLNDDTLLFPEALSTLLTTHGALRAGGVEAIVTGTTQDAHTGLRSYGGWRWQAGWQRRLAPVDPHPLEPVACHTMNGNCTLISQRVANIVGNLDAGFTHSFGDFDYGFRAGQAGFGVYSAPGYLGTCSDNARHGTWRDHSASLRARWRHLNSVKGSPFREWTLYCRRHLGWLWPLYVVSPYLKTLLPSPRRFSSRRRAGRALEREA